MKKTNRGYIYQAVLIARTATGFAVNNLKGSALSFDRLKDAQAFVICNWSRDLIEAQF